MSDERATKEASAVAAIVNEMLAGQTDDIQTEQQVMEACLAATGSDYGMIGVVNELGRYDTTTYSSRTMNDCAFPEALAWDLSTGMEIRGVWGAPMKHGQQLLCNDLPSHPESVGFPEGHVDIHCFLGTPLERDGEVVGMVAVANKPGGYSDADAATLSRLAAIMMLTRQHRDALAQARAMSAELKATNAELESFAYSVSHDLRAPLRAIDGFSKMLVEDFGDSLGPEGKRQIDVICTSTQNMAELIDGLLAYSRLGRQEVSTAQLNMDRLAREVLAVVRAGAEGPEVTADVGDLPPAYGDRVLMREVWTNLFGNAVKYSATREAPQITVRGAREGSELVYSVADNGVGFDMRFADKLFGVFQRLHGAAEFEGTGIGLANVRRIVHRHRGRVWAEGTVGEGATFYFALPAPEDDDG